MGIVAAAALHWLIDRVPAIGRIEPLPVVCAA